MKAIGKYILKGKWIVPEDDLLKWANWFETAKRHIGDDTIKKVRVSTVFLGIDHNLGFSKKPVLFETIIFGGKHWDEAERGHKRAVEIVKEEK